MTGPSLVEFLRARLDEDEAVAERLRSSSAGDPWGWQPNRLETCDKRRVDYPPARVLADVKAKRTIVGLGICLACDVEGQPCDHADETLRHLASVYADHPDYDATWSV